MTFFPSVIDLWRNWLKRTGRRFENNIVFAWFVEREQIGEREQIEHTQMLEAETGLEAHEIVRRLLRRQNRLALFDKS